MPEDGVTIMKAPENASHADPSGKPPSPSLKPRPKGEVIDSEELVGEQLFLYDESLEAVHQLNGGAAIVWLMCDGDQDIGAIAGEIAGAYDLPKQQVLTQVQEAVVQFQSLGLLQS